MNCLLRILFLSLVTLSFITACEGRQPVLQIERFTSTPATLPEGGGKVTLTWEVQGALDVTLEPGLGKIIETSKTVDVFTTTTFVLTATNNDKSVSKTTTVLVANAEPKDTTPPGVISVNPPDNAVGISSDSNIVITFSEAMDQAATQAAYQSATLTSSEVTFSWDTGSTVLTIKPNQPLAYASGNSSAIEARRYSFTLTNTAQDKAGNALNTVTSSFSTLRHITSQLVAADSSIKKGILVDSDSESIYVGDLADNTGIRGFLSFNLASIPAQATLLKATLSLFKTGVIGSPYTALEDCIPACTISGASMRLEHIDYGDTLELDDYDIPALTELATLDNRFIPELTYLTADVTPNVLEDLAQRIPRGNRSQYRLSFPIETNDDNVSDHVLFLASDKAREGFPVLLTEYLAP